MKVYFLKRYLVIKLSRFVSSEASPESLFTAADALEVGRLERECRDVISTSSILDLADERLPDEVE